MFTAVGVLLLVPYSRYQDPGPFPCFNILKSEKVPVLPPKWFSPGSAAFLRPDFTEDLMDPSAYLLCLHTVDDEG